MITIKTARELETMALAGKLLAKVILEVSQNAKVGISLEALDRLAYKLIQEAGATPAFLGYRPAGAERPYPKTICTSVNDVVVHGVPSKYILRSGDLLSLDFGLRLDGLCADAAVTVGIGSVSAETAKLIKVTHEALARGIAEMKAGKHLGDIGYAIERYVTRSGFKVVRGLTGHGIGRELHEEPPVYNFGKKGKGELLREGMVLALEPMVSAGSPDIIQREDEGYATADHSLSAHFEHTVAVTKDGPQILTEL